MTDAPLSRLSSATRRLAVQTAGRRPGGVSHHHADESIGSVITDDAIGFDPLPLLRALHRHGATVVVIGQVAGILHGSTELTGDLDLLWDGQARQAGALVAAFTELGASLTDGDENPLPCDVTSFTLPKVLFRTPSASGDCCTPALPWGPLPVTDFLTSALEVTDRDGTVIRYLTRADLIDMRVAVGRPKDLRRATELQGLP